MATEWMIALVVIGFLAVVAASKSVTKPIRWIGFLALQLVIGGVMLFFVNLVGELAHFHIPINPVTALLAGLLRLPGVAALLVIKLGVM
ncbi:pro-sigmaK processing inhibitor BofA family protein [Brevibacillus sp. H7]|jgi:inhibitor of the pro-sigma K processing machinery|uniref:pro-sigmaK processing inhibitor BofA family protein n=1 Tax=Brevibacillus sp. H7 TaxID=3349138 RepID=UPI00380B85E1